jgi:hypothetical protein
VRFALQNYFADRKLGEFKFRMGDLDPPVRN